MKVLGLTGGVGMGKSTTAQFLRERGAQVVDTDDLARQVVEPGQPGWSEVRDAFGSEIVHPDGKLRRDELARRVFANPVDRQRLESILHPRIRELWRAQLETWREAGCVLAVVVIPLLFETGAESELGPILCVACSSGSQRQRLLARRWPVAQIEQRIQAQWPIERKMALSNYVVWTEAGLDVHAAQLDLILALG
jgi:dephospho-CoA kinase